VTGSSMLSFWAAAQDPLFANEVVHIKVSTTTNNISEFGSSILTVQTLGSIDWTEHNVNLSSYAGQEIYIAFNCTSTDQFVLKIDDILVNNLVGNKSYLNNFEANRISTLGSGLTAYQLYRSEISPVAVNSENRIRSVGADTLNHIDEDVINDTTYYYVVTALYSSGLESIPSNEVSATAIPSVITGTIESAEQLSIPKEYHLSQNFPNPFNPITQIRYELPEAGFVTIKIYDIMGREVRSLVNREMNPGYYTTIWDTRNNNGNPVASGIYIYQMKARNHLQTRKMILMK